MKKLLLKLFIFCAYIIVLVPALQNAFFETLGVVIATIVFGLLFEAIENV